MYSKSWLVNRSEIIFRDYFETMENNSDNSNCIIRLPAAKLEVHRKSFKFSGGKIFNSLLHKWWAATSLYDFLKIFVEFLIFSFRQVKSFFYCFMVS